MYVNVHQSNLDGLSSVLPFTKSMLGWAPALLCPYVSGTESVMVGYLSFPTHFKCQSNEKVNCTSIWEMMPAPKISLKQENMNA